MYLVDIKKSALILILISALLSSLFGTINIGSASFHFFIVAINLIVCISFLINLKRLNGFSFLLPLFFCILYNFIVFIGLFGFLQNLYILSTFLFFLLGTSLSYSESDYIFLKKIIQFSIYILSVFCLLFFLGFNTDIDTRWSSIFVAIIALSGLILSKESFLIKFLSIFLLFFILISGSRGVLLSLIISYIFVKIFFKFSFKYSIPLFILILMIGYTWLEGILELIFSIDIIRERTFYDGVYDYSKIMNFEFDSSGRDLAWPLYWNEIISRVGGFNFLIGSGAGSISDFGVKNLGEAWKHPHNEVIRVLYDYGLIGLLSFLCFWFFLIKKILKTKEQYLKEISLVLIFFMSVIMLTDNPIMYPIYFGNFFMFILGMACASLKLKGKVSD